MILIQIILFPFHFLFRIAARTILLIFTLGAALIIPISLIIAWMALREDALSELPDFLTKFLNVYILLSTLGVFGAVLKLIWKAVLSTLSKIGKAILEIVGDGWMPYPALDFRKSIAVTRERNIDLWFTSAIRANAYSWQLVIASSMAVILVLLAYLSMTKDNQWRTKDNQWRNEVLGYLHDPPPHVVVMAPNDPVSSYLFQKGTVFSLPFVEDGSPRTGAGICLTDYHKAWLAEFKDAVVKCSEKSKVLLEVVGFASIAPDKGEGLGGGGGFPSSDPLNCEIGNRRAEEVVDFLIADGGSDLACGTGADRRRDGDDRYGRKNQCQRSKSKFEFEIGPKLGVKISYKPWACHNQLALKKPADDGCLERGRRRYAVEFLNRSVHLKLGNDACKTERTTTKADVGELDDPVKSLPPREERPPSAA